MLNFILGFAAGAIVAVISPPVFRFVGAQVVRFNEWRATL